MYFTNQTIYNLGDIVKVLKTCASPNSELFNATIIEILTSNKFLIKYENNLTDIKTISELNYYKTICPNLKIPCVNEYTDIIQSADFNKYSNQIL